VRPSGDLTAALRPLIENKNADLAAEALKLVCCNSCGFTMVDLF
jgi:hypothetical protein